jgi:outer membrane protein OmpA-like peptidoglycan-associated protein
MRLVSLLASAILAISAASASAKVDVDLGVLDQLAPAPPAKKPPSKPATKPALPAAKPAPPAAQADKLAPPAAKAETPAAPPPAPIIVESKKAPEPPSPAAPAAVIEMPPVPKSDAAALDRAAAQRPDAVPELPTFEKLAAPAVPPPAKEPPPMRPFAAIPFVSGAADLSPEAKGVLTTAAERLTSDDRLHVVLLAYAAADDPSQARRLSLSRALAARSFLVERGVDTQRIDLRPLGVPGDGSGGDRVDLRLARH